MAHDKALGGRSKSVQTGKESDFDFVQNVISRANMEKRLNELEAAKSEIQSWHSSIQNEPCVPAGATPEPKMLLDYLQALKSSEESLREQLEKAKKKEAAFIVTFAKREQEIAELKVRRLLLDPAIHEEFTRLKGSVSIRMSLFHSRLCFVCSHLTSGQKDGAEQRRNAYVNEIPRRTCFSSVLDSDQPQTIPSHE
ncbi:hypothetical protein AHAS_Ahas12G0112300 [Arachis hypogaea]